METKNTLCSREGCKNEKTKTHSWCNECRVAYNKQYRHDNPEIVKGWKNTPYNPDYYQKNKERILAQHKEWRKNNPEVVRNALENWKRNNEGHTYTDSYGYVRYIGYEHPATNASGLTGYHRIVLWDKLNGADAVPCHWGCGKTLYWNPSEGQTKLCVDHVNLVKDDNSPSNLVPACASCNSGREGGSSRVKIVYGDCAVDFCDRKATATVGDYSSKWSGEQVCKTHYVHIWSQGEPKPIKAYKRGGFGVKTDKGRECMTCHEFKTYEHFYIRNTGIPQAHCKVCQTKAAQEYARKRKAQNIPCSIDGCDSPVLNTNLCQYHYGKDYYERTHNK